MKIGTKSLLFGVHQFLLHPFFLALAWNRLYGFPKSIRLWFCFFLHDIGYWGKANMDGPNEGQRHPELGAKVIRYLFGEDWGKFCLYHSRFYAKAEKQTHSKLCVCDKLAFCCYNPHLYIWLARNSGEFQEYREFAKDNNEFEGENLTDLEWLNCLRRYTLRVTIQTIRSYYNYIEVGDDYENMRRRRRIRINRRRGLAPRNESIAKLAN